MPTENHYYRKPKLPLGKIAIGTAIALFGVHFFDPHIFDGAINLLNKGGDLSGITSCADVDKQYHFVPPSQAGYSFNGPQTASCAAIQSDLQAHHSPIASQEPQIYKSYAEQGINNAAAMALAWQKGQWGTIPGSIQQTHENIGLLQSGSQDSEVYPNPRYIVDKNGWLDFHPADVGTYPSGWVASAQDHAAFLNSWINADTTINGVPHHFGDGSVDVMASPSAAKGIDGTMNHLYQLSEDFHNAHPSYPDASVGTDVASLTPTLSTRRG